MTVTPVLCSILLLRMKRLDLGDSPLVARLKRWDEQVLNWSFPRARWLTAIAAVAVVVAMASVPFLPRAFLPAFNEGSLVLGMVFDPGTALAEANRMGALAETLIAEVPEVTQVGRRTGRAELDEHAEGVHSAEIDVDLKRSGRDRETITADIRARLAVLPAQVAIGQPISHRLDHLLSDVRAQIALKIFAEDTDTLRSLGEQVRRGLAGIPGLVDLSVEKQVLIPQITVRIDHRRGPQDLANTLVDTPAGRLPVSSFATVEETDGPNRIGRENGRRRIVVYANTDGSDMGRVVATRNGILKISHYINLCRFEGEQFTQSMIVRGSLERLTPVLMTALVAAFALTPLLLAADAPGKEILHPVAVVIFGGLISSTLLDTLLTPLLFWRFGRPAAERLAGTGADTGGTTSPERLQETY